jgi:CRISPR-associated protein Csb1
MTTENLTNLFDSWIEPDGPVALHLKQKLLPVEGEGGVIFPPTYADIGYNIDTLSDGTKVATIDSVGSQANRMEPMFKLHDYANLVPQIEIEYGDGRKVSLFEVGHRLGDALIRSTNLKNEAQQAFKTLLETGNAQAIAKLAPTSLVFGVWDSRDTQAKLPRLVQSVIRAWGVDELTRSAQYNPPIDYSANDVFSDEEKAKQEGDPKSPLAKRGFVHVPSTSAPGGIISNRIEQDITVNLIALRRIQAGDAEGTQKLRRYLLGLSLVAATAPLDGFLRQGCLLTPAPDGPSSWKLVNRDGKREDIALTHEAAKLYAGKVAEAFVVGTSKSGNDAIKFDKDAAKNDAAEGNKKAAGKAKGGKGRKTETEQPEETTAGE